MVVKIDGETAEDFAQEGSVTDVAGRIIEALRAEGKAVVGIRICGVEVTPDSLQDRFADVDPAEAEFDITTRPLRELVLETLDEMAQSLPELPEACRKLAQVFQGENPEQGYEPFNELASVWEVVKSRQELAASALDLDFGALELKGLSVAEHLRELNGFLTEAIQALRDGDTILLGDLLEYELAPRAELEAELVAALRQHAEAATP